MQVHCVWYCFRFLSSHRPFLMQSPYVHICYPRSFDPSPLPLTVFTVSVRQTYLQIAVLHSASIVRRGLILLAFLLAHTAVSLFAHPVNLCPPPVLHVLLAWTIMAL